MNFPIIDANLLTPSVKGRLAICSNSTAPGEVLNSIPQDNRDNICVIGSLIVNRDGAERMIINSLAHDSLENIILFGEETETFKASSNLLQAVTGGYKDNVTGNYIVGGVGAAHQYPNISKALLDKFIKKVDLIPLFTNHSDSAIISNYLESLKPKISPELYELLKEVNIKGKMYYDTLNKVVKALSNQKPKKRIENITLNVEDFKHLQPPKSIVEDTKIEWPKEPPIFKVNINQSYIELLFNFKNSSYSIKGSSAWEIAKTFVGFIDESKSEIPLVYQLLLGSELGRAETELVSGYKIKSIYPNFDRSVFRNPIDVPINSPKGLVTDKKYYYKIVVKETIEKISIQCLAYDSCEDVFELISPNLESSINEINKLNRYEEYKFDLLHRIDTGIELTKAYIAMTNKGTYIQDFRGVIKVNKDKSILVIAEGDTFLTVHKGLVTKVFTEGVTEPHADSHKGIKREATSLAIYRGTNCLDTLPNFYQIGEQTPEEIRKNYKEQLLRFDSDGSYSYGNRTREFFGFDQLEAAKNDIKNGKKVSIIARFDPVADMMLYEEDGVLKGTHDPCLTHDIYIVNKGELIPFHIARAHNVVNAYPENIFGLHDAYDTYISNESGVKISDTYMLSSRANVLLLNESQQAKKIMDEPSKPYEFYNSESGPKNIKVSESKFDFPINYLRIELQNTDTISHPILSNISNYNGVDLIEKASLYLKRRGGRHNNPIISDFDPKKRESYISGMPFLQINEVGGKITATGVFLGRCLEDLSNDVSLVNYIATRFSKVLDIPLGFATLFFLNYERN